MILYIFSLLLRAPAATLDADVVARADAFLAREARWGVISGHESVIRLRRDGDGKRVKTRLAVLVISGLYNSPASMRPFETHFAELGLNVISLRLAGHYERDRAALDGGVRWPTWRRQAACALDLARELGDEVVLVGHSTGALLSTWLAAEAPRGIAGLGLFAPAFGLHPVSRGLVSLLSPLKFGREVPRGRYVTTHAADQVRRMAAAFRDEMTRAGGPSLADRLADVPVWMANTALDVNVDVRLARQIFRQLERGGRAQRQQILRPWCERLIHDQFASSSNPHLPELLRSFDAFLDAPPP